MEDVCFFFFNDTATTEIYTLSLHDALPIYGRAHADVAHPLGPAAELLLFLRGTAEELHERRSEEHTSELQSRQYLVCRLLLEKKNKPHALSVDLHVSSFPGMGDARFYLHIS